MLESGFKRETPPQFKENQGGERLKEEMKEFLLSSRIAMLNLIGNLEGERQRFAFGPEPDREGIRICQLKQELIRLGLSLIESKARELGLKAG